MNGKQLKAARALLGISQPELSERVGIGRSTVLRIEQGLETARPGTIETIKAWLEAQGIRFLDGADGVGVILRNEP